MSKDNDEIIVRPKKANTYIVIFLFVGITLLLITSYTKFHDVGFTVVWGLCLYYMALIQWVAFGKTLQLSKEGIKVSFLFIKRFYCWNQLKVKRYVNLKDKWVMGDMYTESVEFSHKNIKESRHLKSASHCLYSHPFSLIFIYFKNDFDSEYLGKVYTDKFVADMDEDIFWEKIRDWGVEITGKPNIHPLDTET